MKLLLLSVIVIVIFSAQGTAEPLLLHDVERDRDIPTEIYYPKNAKKGIWEAQCPVVILSAGYGELHTNYSFVAKNFQQAGYLVVAIGHELPNDPPLSTQGVFTITRAENWNRGAITIDYVRTHLKTIFTGYNFEDVILFGHSNGGDISASLVNENSDHIKSIITLDHRRAPVPLDINIPVLSIRASDLEADEGVLPSDREKEIYPVKVIKISNARHNDMTDNGSDWLKLAIIQILTKNRLVK